MKKSLFICLIFTILFSFIFNILLLSKTKGAVIKEIKLVQDFGIPSEDFIGALSLSEVNFYEDDYNSTYLFPFQGICINDEDKLAVLDTAYGRVHVLNQAYINSFTFGSINELLYPTDIDYANQNYYISDALGKNIKIYSKAGIYVKTVSNGLINTPVGIAVVGSNIFVSDYFGNAIYKLDSNGTVLKSFNILFPGGLSTNHKDTIVAISMSDKKCYLFDVNLNQILSFSISALVFPSDSAIDSSFNIYIADRGLSRGLNSTGKVAVYGKNGAFIKFIGTSTSSYPNQPEGTFLTPSGIAIDSSNKIYVIDSGYYYWNYESEAPFGFPIGLRISAFSTQGFFLSKKDFLHSQTKGILVNPISATLDENGNIWILNYGGFDSSSIVQYSQSGNFIREITSAGNSILGRGYCVYSDRNGNIFVGLDNAIAKFSTSGIFKQMIPNTQFGAIRKIIKGKDGYLYAVSSSKNLVLKFDNSFNIVSSYSVCKFPSGLAQNSSGNFYITSLSDNKIYVYNSLFKQLYTIGKGPGKDREQLYIPEDVAIDRYDNIIVTDTENGRISIWSKDGSLVYLSSKKYYGLASIIVEGNFLLVTDCFHNVVRILSEEFESVDYAFYVSFQPSEITLAPGESETVILTIQNSGTQKDAYLISFESNLPQGSYIISDSAPYSYSLNPNELKKLVLNVKIPINAKEGESFEIIAKVKSQSSNYVQSINIIFRISESLPTMLYAEDQNIQEGTTFLVPVYVKSARDLRGVSFDIIYDTNKINLLRVDSPSEKEDRLITYNITSRGASVAVSLIGGEKINGKSAIAMLKFSSNTVFTNAIIFDNAKYVNMVDQVQVLEAAQFVVVSGPKLSVNIKDGIVSNTQTFSFTGITNPQAKIYVNGSEVSVSSSGSFSAKVILTFKENLIKIVAKVPSGEETTIEKTVLYSGAVKTIIVLKIGNPVMSVNGIDREIDPGRGTTPIIIPEWSRTIVPIRAIVEALNGKVDWDPLLRQVIITLGTNIIKLTIEDSIADVNGKKVQIDSQNPYVKPLIINSRTFVPLRFVAESLGCEVQWEDKTKTITITYIS